MEIPSLLTTTLALISLIPPTLAQNNTTILPTQCEIHSFTNFDLYTLGISGNISIPTNPCTTLEKAIIPSLALEGPAIKFQCVYYANNTLVAFFNAAKNAQTLEAVLTLAFPMFAFGCKAGKSALVRYSDPPPPGCKVKVAGGHEVFGMTLPVPYGETACGKVRSALREYMVNETAFVCEPFEGLWTVAGFAGKSGDVDGVNQGLKEAFDEFEVKCEVPETETTAGLLSTASVPSTAASQPAVSSSATDTGVPTAEAPPATCTVLTKDGKAFYNFTLPVEYKESTCNDAKTALTNENCILEEQSWSCQPNQEASTNGSFIGHQGVTGKVEKALASWHAFGMKCDMIAAAIEG